MKATAVKLCADLAAIAVFGFWLIYLFGLAVIVGLMLGWPLVRLLHKEWLCRIRG